MKSVLKYPGAKNRLTDWICSYIPKHEVYLEPYAGSMAVFLAKEQSKIETLNDLDGNVVNYFRVVRDHPMELISKLEMTPYARDEYNEAFKVLEEDSDVEKARKFAVQCWQGFGCSNLYRNGFRTSQQGTSPHTTKEWREIPLRLQKASNRLMNAQIENLPALELIKRYNTRDVFMYIDPPYLHSTRKNYLSKYEMDDSDHVELLEILVQHPGKILISGYENDLYNQYLVGWKKVHKKAQAEAGLSRVETLWMNYQINQMDIFDFL